MSVLIKGMEMPLRCFECPCCHTIGYFECVLMHKDLRREHGINIGRPDWCPLVEIKVPHERLIDADVLKQSAHLDGRIKTYIDTWIDSQATVIEAEATE